MEMPAAYSDYRKSLIRQMWKYGKERFANHDGLFDMLESDTRPPVFLRDAACHNVIVKSDGEPGQVQAARSLIEPKQRHKWYGSMMSSQALAQSVFANLKAYGKLGLLSEIIGEDGSPLFHQGTIADSYLNLEHEPKLFGEKRPTSVDVFFDGPHRIAVECKLGEVEVGPCSQLPPHCDGSCSCLNRKDRCYLSGQKIAYWEHIPKLFTWSSDKDYPTCPLRKTYQLVRNVLVACMGNDGEIDPAAGHVVLLYDDRNPAFQSDGKGWEAFVLTRKALKEPNLLQSCTWQQVVEVIRGDGDLDWLAHELHMKYGL